MKTVKEVMDTKGNQIWTIEADRTVFNALEIMAEKDVGALLVLQNGKLAGIISERDYARKVILKGASSLKTPVSEIMTSKVAYVTPEQTVDECMALMTENRCRHMPVMQQNKLVGIISIGDLVKASIAEKEFLIGQLENYISGDFTTA